MSNENACAAWLQELRRLCGLNTAEQGMEWRGESFYWQPASPMSPDHVKVFVWVGPYSDDLRHIAIKQLLWMQMQSLGPCSPVFGCNPDSSEMVIAQALPWKDLSPVDALSLLGLLADLAAQSRELMQSQRGSEPTASPPSASPPASRSTAPAAPKAAAGPGGMPVAAKTGTAARPLPHWWLPMASRA